ncbi:hypothetical protein [Rubrobacter calidifluminis]|uniref:hypothetical protein n=1 Tax=Rubrobacter calidifluminis TaxID=1392640 RepID=UPI00235FFB30|nr:hypothetical protein [Rubrobacter calidifluminis]
MGVIYTGNGTYCYSDSLHMSLLASGADKRELPGPGFLECLTTMPFGNTYLRLEEGPLVFFSGPDPDRGLRRALGALGWSCDEWYGGSGEEALERLREAVEAGPVLAGPLDMGYLPYNPEAAYVRGVDHFVVVLEVIGDQILLHDPAGYPCAVMDAAELLEAWRADAIDYKRGPYTLRSGFRRVEEVRREESISRTLPLAWENVEHDPGGPVAYGGPRALRMLAGDLRREMPPVLVGHLTHFALPLAARRGLDAARFLREACREEAAGILEGQARLFGEAQYLAVRRRWPEVAAVVERLAGMEEELAGLLRG